MEQGFILRLYGTNLLAFSLSKPSIRGLKTEVHEINQAERSQFLLDMELSNTELLKWLQRRVIPKNCTYSSRPLV